MFYAAVVFFFFLRYISTDKRYRKNFDFVAYTAHTEMKFVQGEAWNLK